MAVLSAVVSAVVSAWIGFASEKNQISKVLHDANVKLSGALKSLYRVSGQAPEVLQ